MLIFYITRLVLLLYCNVFVKISVNNTEKIHSFGNDTNDLKLFLLYSGIYDSGHYDIIDYYKNNINREINKINNHTYNDKRRLTNMDNLIKIIGDGNCLFRCFSYFLHNDQKYYMKVRHSIVQNVAHDWENKKIYILGNEYYQTVLNIQDYIQFK